MLIIEIIRALEVMSTDYAKPYTMSTGSTIRTFVRMCEYDANKKTAGINQRFRVSYYDRLSADNTALIEARSILVSTPTPHRVEPSANCNLM